ncbi:MAG: hypothetical protein ABJN42_14450 [Roseibium sp.]|uniref:hypothetical protein n=1 Tax=Roseibium sp. TaxID=1936156 RepID=UPI00329A2E94
MGFKLQAVSGFGTYPDGRLRAGPFCISTEELSSLMTDLRIFPGENVPSGMISSIPSGLMMSAAGAGVTGYLVDDEGLEVSQTDLDQFVVKSTEQGALFRMSGHYCPEPKIMISSDAVAIHDGRHVSWHSIRRLRTPDGMERAISASRPEIAPALAVAI